MINYGDYMSRMKTLIRNGFFHILFGSTAIKMISFISSIVIVRFVSKEEYAYYAYGINVYSYINLIAGLGLATALLKYASSVYTNDYKKAYFIIALKYGTITQLLLSIILVTLIQLIDIPFPQSRLLINISIFLPSMVFIVSVLQVLNRANLRNKIYTKTALIQSVCTFVFSIVLVLLFGIIGVPIAQYGALIVTIIYSVRYIIKDFSNVQLIKLDRKKVLSFIHFGLSLMLISFFSMVMQHNELFLVNNIIKDEISTANYKVAMLIPSQITIISGAIVIYFFPIISNLAVPGKIKLLSVKIGVINFIFITFLSVVGLLLTPSIIKIVYGDRYVDAVYLSRIFWIVYWINSSIRMIPMNILPAIGVVKINVIITGFSASAHLLLNYLFINLYGLAGVAYSTGIIYLISGVMYWVVLIIKLKE